VSLAFSVFSCLLKPVRNNPEDNRQNRRNKKVLPIDAPLNEKKQNGGEGGIRTLGTR
jgi:hypothetical protein